MFLCTARVFKVSWMGEAFFKHHEAINPRDSSAVHVRWYEAGTLDTCMLLINEGPPWHVGVFATRYSICSGWYAIAIGSSISARQEATRLDMYLHRRWFSTPLSRRKFRSNNPKCAFYSVATLRDKGMPFVATHRPTE